MTQTDRRWLDAAARLALPWRGTTADNPVVGAILVAPDGRMVGRGVTARGGRPHAETRALAMAGDLARGATLYVTLEPCAHWGRTPPCVDAVIAAGVGRVVVGLRDPDPRTAGTSLARLDAAGIKAILLDHPLSRRLHEGHVSRILRGRPVVSLKLATSADAMAGRRDTPNLAITGEVARRWTHMQRAQNDAVMVGAGTARIDAPRLTVRLPGLAGRAPLRVLLEGRAPLPADLIQTISAAGQPILVLGLSPADAGPGWERAQLGAATRDGRPDLDAALSALAQRGIGRVLVEGGPTLSDALLDAGLVDRFFLLQSPDSVGEGGVPASVHGTLPDRLTQHGLALVAKRALGCDRLTSFERP